MPTTQFPAVFNLADLNGQNGFKIEGENNNNSGGISVGAARDINGDGHDDLIIGVPNYNGKGRSYVVFGGPGVGSSGVFSLSNLNGTNGFKLDGGFNGYPVGGGDINGDGYNDLLIGSYVIFGGLAVGSSGLMDLASLNGANGFSVTGDAFTANSAAGDVNGDNKADFLLGAAFGTGCSYVIFGGPGIGSGGSLASASLNGANGFKINGEIAGDSSGSSWSVSAADINGDGYTDLLIGAYYGASLNNGQNNAGRSYVIFGGPGVGVGGLLELTSLTGANGFKIDSELEGMNSMVVGAGDINGDGVVDLLIGTWRYGDRSYVVFGGAGVGRSGLISLASLNGQNGFKLDGGGYNYNGCALSPVGDINGDGITDLLIGTDASDSMGHSYVVFGGSEVGSSGLISLASLNGQNGFKLDGQVGDYSGYSVSPAGDINGDGLADILIGAPYSNNNNGRTYVIFGDIAPQLLENQLTVHAGETIILTSQNLNGTDNSPLTFKISNVQHGHFEYVIAPGKAITVFSQSQVGTGQVQFVHDGSSLAPSYSVQTPNPGVALTPSSQLANITFYRRPVLQNNVLTVHQGESIPVTTTLLSAIDDYPAYQVNFTVSNLQQGQFKLLPLNNFVAHFTEQQVMGGQVVFVQDGSANSPSYQININDPYFSLPSVPASITFYRTPTLAVHPFNIHQSETVAITAQILNVTDDYPPNLVNFVLSNVQHGQFQLTPLNNLVTQFSEQQLLIGEVFFAQDGTTNPPSYQVSIMDPFLTLSAVNGSVNFYHKPVLNQRMSIHQGESLLITSSVLNVTDDYSPDQVVFTISNLQHGQVELLPVNTSITQFTEQQILTGQVLFVHDGSVHAPLMTYTISDPYFTLAPKSAAISFYSRPVPGNNQLLVHQGESVVMNPAFLSVVDDYPATQVMFTVSNLQHGQFKLLPLNSSVTQFTEQQLTIGEVEFVHDDSASAPSYQVSASDPYFALPATSAAIIFYWRPVFIHNQLTVTRNGTVMITLQQLQVSDNYTSSDAQVLFTVQTTHGQFELIASADISPQLKFTQQQIISGQIQFHHDGSIPAPSYNVTVSDGFFTVGPVAGSMDYQFIAFPPQVTNRVLPKIFSTGQAFEFTIPPDTFFDPNGYALQLSAALASGDSLPPQIKFDSVAATFTGLVNQASDWNISMTATDTGHLSAQTFFDLQISDSLISSSCSVPGLSQYPSTDWVCTTLRSLMIGIPSAFGTIALSALGLWLRRRDIEKTWAEPRYAIHNHLRRELKLEIGRATQEVAYISGIYKLLGAVLGMVEEDQKRDSNYGFLVGERVAVMTAEEQKSTAQALAAAIRQHIIFRGLYRDKREIQIMNSVRLEMPIYRYFNSSVPNPLSCLTTYEFRSDALGAASAAIVASAITILEQNLAMERLLVPLSISTRSRGSSALFNNSPETKDRPRKDTVEMETMSKTPLSSDKILTGKKLEFLSLPGQDLEDSSIHRSSMSVSNSRQSLSLKPSQPTGEWGGERPVDSRLTQTKNRILPPTPIKLSDSEDTREEKIVGESDEKTTVIATVIQFSVLNRDYETLGEAFIQSMSRDAPAREFKPIIEKLKALVDSMAMGMTELRGDDSPSAVEVLQQKIEELSRSVTQHVETLRRASNSSLTSSLTTPGGPGFLAPSRAVPIEITQGSSHEMAA